MANKEDILKEAEYYLNNDLTIEQASVDLGISKRTFQLHLKKLEELAPETYKLVTEKKAARIVEGRILGGTVGKRGATWTQEEADAIKKQMIEQNLTYAEAESITGIPKSTIYEMVHKNNSDKTNSLLYSLARANEKNMALETYMKMNDPDNSCFYLDDDYGITYDSNKKK